MGWLENRHLEQSNIIESMNPQIGDFANLTAWYGDVWAEIVMVYPKLNDNNTLHTKGMLSIATDDPRKKTDLCFFYQVQKISKRCDLNLSNTRVIYTKDNYYTEVAFGRCKGTPLSEFFGLPTREQLEIILKTHPLVKLREKIRRAYIVGSFTTGHVHETSDIDVLIEIKRKKGVTPKEVEEKYRSKIRKYFIQHDIMDKDDSVHPNWNGRRIDIYFTYDSLSDPLPKFFLDSHIKNG
jgi:predicted nucleotidyltransferase